MRLLTVMSCTPPRPCLSPQVSTLQHQVGSLAASRDAQDRELARLRAEALALAAAAASLGDSPPGSAGNGPGVGNAAATPGRHGPSSQAAAEQERQQLRAERDAAREEAAELRAALERQREQGTWSSGGGGGGQAGGPGDAALRGRVSELERRNSELLQELRTVGGGVPL